VTFVIRWYTIEIVGQHGAPLTPQAADVPDLRVEGPVSALTFERIYTSDSDDRSILGSNWTHNYDVWLETIKPANFPVGAPEYCRYFLPIPTCVLYHDGQGGVRLFLRDPITSLFVPFAGSTDTIRKRPERDGWVLRTAQGHLRMFNEQGYMVEDRDRFGNGYRVEYESTPLFLLYDRYCTFNS